MDSEEEIFESKIPFCIKVSERLYENLEALFPYDKELPDKICVNLRYNAVVVFVVRFIILNCLPENYEKSIKLFSDRLWDDIQDYKKFKGLE